MTLLLLVLLAADGGADVVTVRKGDTLWSIAEKQYGNRHASVLLADFNHVSAKLSVGAELKVPAFEVLMRSEQMAVNKVAPVALDAVLAARAALPSKSPELARQLTIAIDAFGKVDGCTTPRSVVTQLRSSKDEAERLLSGHTSMYEADVVDQHLLLALEAAVKWARAGCH
jgi:LysM repeat protein